jgi:tetratricopeptide (TPR) repeat protein
LFIFRAKYRFLVLCATVGFSVSAHSQLIDDPVADQHIRRGIEYVYNLEFDNARAEFQQVTQRLPDHPAGYFFLASVEWWKIVTNIENTSNDKRFLNQLNRVIALCDQRLDKNEKDVAALFFKGGALGFRGRLHGIRSDWLNAANDGRQALPVVQEAHKLAPNNFDVFLGIGIYNYYADVIPDRYPFVKPLMFFFPKGDRQKGLMQLRQAAEKGTYARTESMYFLLQVLQHFERQPAEALALAESLHHQYPNNMLFHKYVGRVYASLGRWDAMYATWMDILNRINAKQVGYDTFVERETQYYLGLYEMQMGRHDEALHRFQRCDQLSTELDKEEVTGFMTMANLKMGMIYDLQAKRDSAVAQYKKVLKMSDFQNAHKLAESYLKKPYGQT